MAKKPDSWDLFLSYSSKDRKKAETILTDLESSGLRVWYDRKQILGGDRIREKIGDGIRNSKCVLILASNASLQSPWVLNELDAAMIREIDERRKIVIPVLLGNIETERLPNDIRGKNCIDLRHQFEKRYRDRRDTLLNSLRAISEPVLEVKTIPIGDEAIRYILAYQYVGFGEKFRLNDEFIESLVDIFIDSPRDGEHGEEITEIKNDFVNKYGRW